MTGQSQCFYLREITLYYWPDSPRRVTPRKYPKKIDQNPIANSCQKPEENYDKTPKILTITQSTYDGILYNVELIKDVLNGHIDTLHFDEAWVPHAAFHDFIRICMLSVKIDLELKIR